VTAVAFGPHGAAAVSAPVRSIAFSPDGRWRAVGLGRGIVRLSSLRDGKIRVLRTGAGAATALAFSGEGRTLGVGTESGRAELWDVETGRRVRTLSGHKQAVTALAFSRDASFLFTASRDRDVRFWRTSTGVPTGLLRIHFGPVLGVGVSPDGRWIVTAGPGTAGLASTADPTDHTLLRGHSKPLVGAGFAGRDGRTIVTAARDGTIRAYRCAVLCGNIQQLIEVARRRVAGRR
jgi:WD40 repeat protein